MLSHIRTAASKTWLPALAVLTTIAMLTARTKTQQSVLLMGVNGGAPVAISANATGQINTTVASGGGTFTSSVAINGSGSQLTFNTNGTATVPNILMPTAQTGIYSTGANVAFTVSGTLIAYADATGFNLNATTLNSSTSNLDFKMAASTRGGISTEGFTAGASDHLLFSTVTAPTISSGFCTSPSIVSNNGSTTFRVNVGTTCGTSGVVGLPSTGVATGWNCQVIDTTTNIVTRETAFTTSSVTVTAASAWTNSDILMFNCTAF